MRSATGKGIKNLVGALFLLTFLNFGVAAQSPIASTNGNPTITTVGVLNRDQTDSAKSLSLAEAVNLALQQASIYKTAQIAEQIAAEDVKQAKSAFYPKVAANPTLVYTSPSLSNAVTPRPPSFLGANAITEYQAVVTTSGEIDTSGKLKATLERNKFLVQSAHAGSEIARQELINSVTDAYFNLALSTTKRRGAELNLAAAQEFENNIKLQLDAGEVAPVDLVRARLQTAARSDELEQAKTDESVNGDQLRVLIGYDFSAPISAEDLLMKMPGAGEIENYTETLITTRPEFARFEADRRAAEDDVKIAKADRKPQITYSVSTGFISDSLRPGHIGASTGVQATVGVSIPLFDKGASRSRETQAKLKIQQAELNKQIAERQFMQAFYSARTQAVAARNRISRLAQTIRDAESNVDASTARYRAGEATIVEVTDAQNTLIIQRQALYQAIFDYQTARAKLLRAIGQ